MVSASRLGQYEDNFESVRSTELLPRLTGDVTSVTLACLLWLISVPVAGRYRQAPSRDGHLCDVPRRRQSLAAPPATLSSAERWPDHSDVCDLLADRFLPQAGRRGLAYTLSSPISMRLAAVNLGWRPLY